MSRSQRVILVSLVGWTFYVWGTRVANILRDQTLGDVARALDLALAASFLVFAVVVSIMLRRSWSDGMSDAGSTLIRAFVAWTAVVWVVRLVEILSSGHTTSFKAVHTVIGLLSIGLGAAAWRLTMPTREAAQSDQALSSQWSDGRLEAGLRGG